MPTQVITSSFAAIINPHQGNNPGHTYSEEDWNPLTHEEALQNPAAGYRGKTGLQSLITAADLKQPAKLSQRRLPGTSWRRKSRILRLQRSIHL